MKKWIAPVSILIAMLLDYLVFNIAGIKSYAPDCLVAVFIALSLGLGMMPMMLTGILLGLAIDAVANTFVGGTSKSLVLASAAGGLFHGKFYADNAIIPGALAAGFVFLRENFMYFLCKIMGRNLAGFGGFMLMHILPSSLLTGIICAFAYLLIKKGKYEFSI